MNDECNVCFKNYKKLNKCIVCSFRICDICISKLNTLKIKNKLQYDCCACKEINFLNIKNITNINVMKNIYSKMCDEIVDLEDTHTEEEHIILNSIVLIYNAPVISNNNVTYFNNNIIALKTQYDNDYATLELYDKIDPRRALYNITYFSYIPQVEYHFIYSNVEYDYTLLPNKSFYELVNENVIEFD